MHNAIIDDLFLQYKLYTVLLVPCTNNCTFLARVEKNLHKPGVLSLSTTTAPTSVTMSSCCNLSCNAATSLLLLTASRLQLSLGAWLLYIY